jgi:hypothetical protein
MRFFGAVGYASDEQSASGVWQEVITEVNYYGDVIRNARRLEPPSQVPPVANSGVALENSFSVIGDEQAFGNFTKMRYVRWEGLLWAITNVEVRRPRLILTIGGQWVGNTA